jgi:hypothetical protein
MISFFFIEVSLGDYSRHMYPCDYSLWALLKDDVYRMIQMRFRTLRLWTALLKKHRLQLWKIPVEDRKCYCMHKAHKPDMFLLNELPNVTCSMTPNPLISVQYINKYMPLTLSRLFYDV